MQRLLNFFYEYRAFFTFLLLEVFCAWLLVENNQYQSTKFFNSSNQIAANIMGFSQSTREYFALRSINEELSRENAQLRTLIEQQSQNLKIPGLKPDTSVRYDFISAKVVNNSVAQFKNYITINQGEEAGLKPGMAAISTFGAVGKVKSVSDHFSVLISILNIDEQVSSLLKRTGNIGTIQWDGTDPRMVNLLYVPRHVQPMAGDTVVTSGYNAVFPEGVLVGIVQEVKLKEEALFYDIRVELAQDFRRLSFVKIVKSRRKAELDSLEQTTIGTRP
ncbi:MAG TPA: rod shape-determining protein MreC [Cyclobacteriaceae bacterium]|nr:rod shape-determining protein MreC [Cyclobacteriaceae bacterium]